MPELKVIVPVAVRPSGILAVLLPPKLTLLNVVATESVMLVAPVSLNATVPPLAEKVPPLWVKLPVTVSVPLVEVKVPPVSDSAVVEMAAALPVKVPPA